MDKQGVVLAAETLQYDFGRDHVMNAKRITAAYHLFEELFLVNNNPAYDRITPEEYDRSYLFKAHDKEYIDIVERLSDTGDGEAFEFGLGTPDNPVWKNMADISEFVVKSSVTMAEKVYKKDINYGFVLLGGLHHATKRQASGFCYYNDINVAIHRLKALQDDIRILYLDTDLHHGDGVQFDFYNDPNVLTLSFHESGQYLFPGTGTPDEIGEHQGKGSSINVPFYPYTWDDAYTKTFDQVFPVAFETYEPDLVIWQAGSDAHIRDPLGHMMLTSSTYNHIGKMLREQVLKHMETPKVLSMGGGGYNPYGNAKSWANSFAGLTGFDLPDQASQQWKNQCATQGVTVDLLLKEEQSEPISQEQEAIEEANQDYLDQLIRHHSPYFSFE